MSYEIINSDCLRAMQEMPDGCVDAIVTDPPYGLAFMGAKWDSFNGPNGKQTTKERQDEGRRYATENKGAPRYGNSHGKKVTRNEMVAFQEAMTPIFEEALRVSKAGAHMLCFGGTRTFHRLACAIEDAGWEIRDTVMWVYGSGFPKSMDVGKKLPEWQGWGTCLKPAWEPIIVARKPLDGTVAHNVMTYGTGALNIDGCRVPTGDNLNGGAYSANGGRSQLNGDNRTASGQGMFAAGSTTGKEFTQPQGRFPANLVHDGSQEVLELFPDSNLGSNEKPIQHKRDGAKNVYSAFAEGRNVTTPRHGGNGSAARFFYCAKASKKDRGEGNDHPTVKPNALMRWLVRLVCPQGGTVLDPFMGSGSTGVACMQEGMEFVGIDKDKHYCEIAEKRIGAEPDTVFD